MATKIRLKRIGRRNRPFYRLIIIDSRKRRDGLAIEQVGWYDPLKKDKDSNFSLKEDRILAWLQLGAQVSDPVNKLMKRSGLAYRWHLMSQGLSTEDIEKAVTKWKKDRLEVLKNRKKAKLKKKEKISAESIIIGIPKSENVKKDGYTGKVSFFDHSKGFGFIVDPETQEQFFVHISECIDEIKEGNKVSFDTVKGTKGLNAVKVKVIG